MLTCILMLAAVFAIIGSVFAAAGPPPTEAVSFLAGIKDTNAIESWSASILPRLSE